MTLEEAAEAFDYARRYLYERLGVDFADAKDIHEGRPGSGAICATSEPCGR